MRHCFHTTKSIGQKISIGPPAMKLRSTTLGCFRLNMKMPAATQNRILAQKNWSANTPESSTMEASKTVIAWQISADRADGLYTDGK
jgi:hypothetical protein